MKFTYLIFLLLIGAGSIASCRPTKAMSKAIAPKDSLVVAAIKNPGADSSTFITESLRKVESNYIDFKTFTAKIKVDVQAKENIPELTANLRMIKDSVIWMSVQATFLGIEVYRIRITPDSVILVNKQEREVQYRSLDYLQEVTQIPFDFKSLQDLLIGNPVFFSKESISVRKRDNQLLLYSAGELFKNLLTVDAENGRLIYSKLDDADINRNRTASVLYADYENVNGIWFADRRQVTITEKNKIDIKMNYKQVEFNKELSVSFPVPKNYQVK
jgi:hypothetical protein